MKRIEALPRDDSTNGWFRTLPERTPKASLAAEVRADWIVVGAGLVGLAVSRRLAENRPNDKVVLLEAQRVGDAASGRNSGFIIDVAHNLGSTDLDNLESARRSMRLSRAALAYHQENVTRHGIQCQWSQSGQFLSAVSGEGEAALEHHSEELGDLDEPYRVLDRRELGRIVGTEYYRSAVHTPGTVLVQPVAFVRGLADSLPANVSLYEQSPVVAAEYGDRIRVRHPVVA